MWEAISLDHLRVFRLRKVLCLKRPGAAGALQEYVYFSVYAYIHFRTRWLITRSLNLYLPLRHLCYNSDAGGGEF